jgi:hypothetical protein
MFPRQTQQIRYGPDGSRGGGNGAAEGGNGVAGGMHTRMPHGAWDCVVGRGLRGRAGLQLAGRHGRVSAPPGRWV